MTNRAEANGASVGTLNSWDPRPLEPCLFSFSGSFFRGFFAGFTESRETERGTSKACTGGGVEGGLVRRMVEGISGHLLETLISGDF